MISSTDLRQTEVWVSFSVSSVLSVVFVFRLVIKPGTGLFGQPVVSAHAHDGRSPPPRPRVDPLRLIKTQKNV